MNQQPNVLMAFACESVAAETGKPISFHNVLDGIESETFPAQTGRWFAIFCFSSRTPMMISNCRVAIEREGGEIVAQASVKNVAFSEERPVSRNMIDFGGFAWPYPGWYEIKFIADRDTVLASFPMLVQHSPQAEGKEE